MAARPPEDQGDDRIAPRCREQDDLQVHGGVEHPAPQAQPPPPQQSDGQHASAEGAGEQKKDHHLAQQAAAAAEGGEHHQHRRRQPAEGPPQEPEAGQKERHRIKPAQQRPQGEAEPAQPLPGQPGGAEQEQIVHNGVEQEQGIHIDHSQAGHLLSARSRSGPFLFSPAAPWGRSDKPYYRVRPSRKRSQSRCHFQEKSPAPPVRDRGPARLLVRPAAAPFPFPE